MSSHSSHSSHLCHTSTQPTSLPQKPNPFKEEVLPRKNILGCIDTDTVDPSRSSSHTPCKSQESHNASRCMTFAKVTGPSMEDLVEFPAAKRQRRGEDDIAVTATADSSSRPSPSSSRLFAPFRVSLFCSQDSTLRSDCLQDSRSSFPHKCPLHLGTLGQNYLSNHHLRRQQPSHV